MSGCADMRRVRTITGVLFLVGAGLLLLHLAGRFVPLRNPAVYAELHHFPNDITLTYAEARARLVRRPEEAPLAYAVRANGVVNRGMAHYWRDEGADRFRLHIPPWENYLLWALGWIDPETYGKWEFADDDKALRRGVGLCSQHTVILAGALARAGVRSVIVKLGGHIVAMTGQPPNHYVLLDPDYGVVVPHGILEVQRNPDLIRPYYAAAGYGVAEVDHLVEMYGSEEDNVLYPNGPRTYAYWRREQEHRLYTACWMIPPVLMAPYGLVLAVGAVRRRRKGAPPA